MDDTGENIFTQINRIQHRANCKRVSQRKR
jgi:hypothetical protein